MKKRALGLIIILSLLLTLGNVCLAKNLFVQDYNIFVKNEMVAVIPADNPGGIKTFDDLGKKGIRISIGNPKSVPAGNYAMEILKNLQDLNPALGKAVQGNIVTQEANVRAVLDKVASKEVDGGFVYLSDAVVAGAKVKMLVIPKNIQVFDVFYPIAALKESKILYWLRNSLDM